MDPGQELDARTVVNTMEERQLAKVIATYGEDRNARAIAREIARRRRKAPIETTAELVAAVEAALPAAVQAPLWRKFPCKARISSHPHRGQRRAGGPGPGAARGVVDPGRGRPAGRDLVPLARGSAPDHVAPLGETAPAGGTNPGGELEPPPGKLWFTTPRAFAASVAAASARRAAVITPSTVPPCSPRSPRSSNQAAPGRSDSTAAPIPSSAPTIRSQASATPAGSGATRRSVGQRASASPSRSPARTP